MGTTSRILRFAVTQGAAELWNKIVCIYKLLSDT